MSFPKKVLIVGNGGREHAIGKKIAESPFVENLYFSPGNAGTSWIGTNIPFLSIEHLIEQVKAHSIDFVIVGPEQYLVDGIVDALKKEGISAFGPDKNSAQLEGSKVFAKNFMKKYGVKTARYAHFSDIAAAKEYIEDHSYPLVIKASGLAAGKGVLICHSYDEALQALDELMVKKKMGSAGEEIVIEQFLDGFEVSVLSIFNGKEIYPMISAKDHKKIGEGETGLNTGGMGVVAPNPLFTNELYQKFMNDILIPTKKGLLKEQLIFSGVIFFGLMVANDEVYLLEYNVRMGDPETQAVLPLMKNDFLEVLYKAYHGEEIKFEWNDGYAVCVVVASEGYPEKYPIGFEISGYEKWKENICIAGAEFKDGKLYTSGGRVLSIVDLDEAIDSAKSKVYGKVKDIHFQGAYYRKDIGKIY